MQAGARVILLIAVLTTTALASAANLTVYADALSGGFVDCSFGAAPDVDYAEAATVHGGAAAIRYRPNNFDAQSACHSGLNTSGYRALRFWVHGGVAGGQNVVLGIGNASAPQASATLASLLGAPLPNSWVEITANFDSGPLAHAGAFDQFWFQDNSGGLQADIYLDDIALLDRSPDFIFANGFDPVAAPANAIVIERDVNAGGFISDRFTWRDRGNLPRSVVLVHNNAIDPSGWRGGYLRSYAYETPGGTRVADGDVDTNNFAPGFGFVVAHYKVNAGDNGGNSADGHGHIGQFSRPLEGRHHAIHRFTEALPIPGYNVAGTRPVAITIEWLLATGRDHPLWTISYDMNGFNANEVNADSRSPYGELSFDGRNPGSHDTIGGVGWGDRYKFTTTSAALTLNSAWTWNVVNTIPYVIEWTQNVDAEMGIVQTQTILQQDAGGYFGTGRWNTTSASGNACPNPSHLMPCDYNWPYQLNQYSFPYVGGVLQTNATIESKRIAWGTNYGYLGQAQYPEHGFGANRPGHPWQSYSTHIVLDRHSLTPTANQVSDTQNAQTSALTSALGTVRTSGPAGVADVTPRTYVPAGYNHVYASWDVIALANAATVTLTAGGSGLAQPMFVLHGYSVAVPPSSVTFDGNPLVADVDYFATVDGTGQRLWITVNRQWSGAHTLAVTAP